MSGFDTSSLGRWNTPSPSSLLMPSVIPSSVTNPLGLGGVSGMSPTLNTGYGYESLQDWTKPSTLGQSQGMFGGIFDRALPWEETVGGVTQKGSGWLSPALGVAQGLASWVMGSKQYKLAKEQLAANQQQFAQNYAAQRQTTNTALEDRQRARVAAGGDAYESVESYMARNGIR